MPATTATPTATATQHYNALRATHRVALYGRHLFEIVSSTAAAPEGACGQVRLSRLEWTPCQTLEQAQQLHEGYLEQWRDEGLPQRELASSFGYVADFDGNISHWISPNGRMHAVRYLGLGTAMGGRPNALATGPLAAAACSLANDQLDNGVAYVTTGADVWLQAQLSAGGAERPRQQGLA